MKRRFWYVINKTLEDCIWPEPNTYWDLEYLVISFLAIISWAACKFLQISASSFQDL